MVKHPNDTSFSHAHQDWSIVDEESYTSINTWLPLTAVTRDNGAMRLLPQSHKIFNLPRGSYIENGNFDNQKILSEKDFLTLNLLPGDLLLFDTRLVHASFNNTSEKTRVAVGNILIPEKASLFHYYKKNNSINKVKLNDDFLFEYSFGQDFISYLNKNYATDI
jgi:ectoine hydroxylase-related dioxygenase (phytanoyl-CoA dioxygenase family)